jgi:hypothetical protein
MTDTRLPLKVRLTGPGLPGGSTGFLLYATSRSCAFGVPSAPPQGSEVRLELGPGRAASAGPLTVRVEFVREAPCGYVAGGPFGAPLTEDELRTLFGGADEAVRPAG